MIDNFPPSVGEVRVGSLFVDAYSRKDSVIILSACIHGGVRILHSAGKIDLWSYDAFRSSFRRVM